MTVADGPALVIDARVAGVGLATIAVWRRAPFVAVVLAAMAGTAVVRLVT